MDSRYLACHGEQESPEEESHGHQIKETEKRDKGSRTKKQARQRRQTRAHKRAYKKDLGSQAEEAANRGEQGCTRSLSSSSASTAEPSIDTPIVNKQRRLLAMEAEQEARWAEHFSEVLTRPPPTIEARVVTTGS